MKKLEYNSKQVRIFSIILFILIAYFSYKLIFSKDIVFKAVIFSFEGILLLSILIRPRYFYLVFKIALIFSTFIGNIIFKVITTLVFYFILTPIALTMRVFGKKFLNYRINKNLESYYEDYIPDAGIEKQF